MKRRILVLCLSLALVFMAIAVPADAIGLELIKNAVEDPPNRFCDGNTIHYILNVTNPLDSKRNMTVNVYDIYPNGTTVQFAADHYFAIGHKETYTGSYVVDAGDVVLGNQIMNRLLANGTDETGAFFQSTMDMYSTILDPIINITKVASPTSGAPSTNVNFTITVNNTGDCILDLVTVVDTLPSEMSYVSDNSGGTVSGQEITWDLGSMDPGAPTTILLVAHIDVGHAGTLTNNVTATGTPKDSMCDNVTDSSTAVVTRLSPKISVNKAADPTSGAPSTNVTFTITVNNTGNCTLNPVMVVDTLPAGMSYVSDDSGGSELPVGSGTITWDLGSMGSGASTTISLVAHIDTGASGTLTDSVTATGTPPHGDDVSDTDTADVTAYSADIDVNKTADPTSGAPSTNVTFTITVNNTGNCTLNPVMVVDTLPGGMSYVSDDSGGSELPVGSGTITWDLGSMGSGASTTITLIAHIDSGASRTLTDLVNVIGTPPEGDDVTDSDTATVTVFDPGISVNKVANPIAGPPSTDVTFTITVTNSGNCPLDPVKVVDTLPVGMSYVSSSPKGSVVGNTITWNVGPLASGASKTVTLVAHIDEGAAGMLENVVCVTGTPPAGADVHDCDTAEIEVLAKTIVPPEKTLIDVTTEIKSDGIVIEGEQFGWEAGNANLLNNPPLAPGEAVGGIKYNEKMISSNGTTKYTKNFSVNTHVTPNLAVTKGIGYTSGGSGSLSHAEQVGMQYTGASPPLSSNTKCEEAEAYSDMVVTNVSATTEIEVGITETDERNLHYEIDAGGNGTVSAGVDVSVEDGSSADAPASRWKYKDKSIGYGNFTLHKGIGYTSNPP